MLFYHIDACLCQMCVYLMILIGHRCVDLLRITRLEEWSQHDHDSLSHHVTVDHGRYNSELISWCMSLIAICAYSLSFILLCFIYLFIEVSFGRHI